jgi:hypothetical protein
MIKLRCKDQTRYGFMRYIISLKLYIIPRLVFIVFIMNYFDLIRYVLL